MSPDKYFQQLFGAVEPSDSLLYLYSLSMTSFCVRIFHK